MKEALIFTTIGAVILLMVLGLVSVIGAEGLGIGLLSASFLWVSYIIGCVVNYEYTAYKKRRIK